MTVRTTNLLTHNSINTIQDVLDRGSTRLLLLPHFGKRQLSELKEVLEFHGYTLTEDGRW
jgi:DNA-directed RNA polymerase alpha subunit